MILISLILFTDWYWIFGLVTGKGHFIGGGTIAVIFGLGIAAMIGAVFLGSRSSENTGVHTKKAGWFDFEISADYLAGLQKQAQELASAGTYEVRNVFFGQYEHTDDYKTSYTLALRISIDNCKTLEITATHAFAAKFACLQAGEKIRLIFSEESLNVDDEGRAFGNTPGDYLRFTIVPLEN